MNALTQVDLLALWESGQQLHPLDQGLLAVQAAFPETRAESVADWPLGSRNRALAALHCACFGSSLRGWTHCRQCNEKLEFDVDGNALAQTPSASINASVQVEGRSFRLPTSRDLASIMNHAEENDAAAHLLNLCLLDDKTQENSQGWSQEELDIIGKQLASADPLAEILLGFQCPACDESFEEGLDLAAFFWTELEASAKRLLGDVHALASAYGWSEAEILSLNPRRRNFYLEQVYA